jgi:hypothetical protein
LTENQTLGKIMIYNYSEHRIQIGDKVVVNVLKENRNWGYDPAPDGTIAVITAFSEMAWGHCNGCGMRPGIHENRQHLELKDEAGNKITTSTFHLDLHDSVDLTDRDPQASFIRDLPDTDFWLGDVVSVNYLGGTFETKISNVDYNYIDQTRNDGSPYPIYEIKHEKGGLVKLSGDSLTLIERGNIWKHYNDVDVAVDWSCIQEEGRFFLSIGGNAVELRNPVEGCFSWSPKEALDAINNGIGHAIFQGEYLPSKIDYRHNVGLWKFNDNELGARAAKFTKYIYSYNCGASY